LGIEQTQSSRMIDTASASNSRDAGARWLWGDDSMRNRISSMTVSWTVGILGLAALLARPVCAQSLGGYTAQSSAQEALVEARYKAIPDPKETQRQHRLFTAEPHPAGSERNNYLAQYIADEWKKQGLEDVVIRRYDVFSSEPKETLLEMVSPVPYRASLREAAYEGRGT